MGKRTALGLTTVFCTLAGMVGAQSFQSMPGPQTSFPPPGPAMKAFPTPRPSQPKGSPKVLRLFHPTPTPYQSRFYSLQPTPQPTFIRSQKAGFQPKAGPATLLSPRRLKYHSLYQDPTPTGTQVGPRFHTDPSP